MKYTSLTRHIPALTADRGGELRCTEAGRILGPAYSDAQNAFLRDYQDYLDAIHETFTDYGSVVGEAGDKPIRDYTPRQALAKIFSFIRGERFCDGCLLDAFQSGEILECLYALRAYDETGGKNARDGAGASLFARLKAKLTRNARADQSNDMGGNDR